MTQTTLHTIFASSCVEAAARAENCSASDMYRRMQAVGLIENYIWKHYDSLHSQSREYVTEDVLDTLHNWEEKALKAQKTI
mgnify:CR=1 FL=1